jgi:ankyrin repeat protein
VKELLKRGADPDLKNYNGNTPLIIATSYDNLDIIKELLNHGADPHIKNNRDEAAFDIARKRGNRNIINYLTDFIYAPLVMDPNTGISNLAIVAANGPLDRLINMVDYAPNLNIDQQDRDGNTALIYAIINQKPEHVAFLLDRGADPNLANFAGGTPLAYAIQTNQPDLEQILIDAGAQ